MKKILFGVITMLLVANCSGNGSSEKAKEDSARIADSIEQDTAVAEQAADQVQQDSIATAEKAKKANVPSPNAKKIDKLLKSYMLCAKQHDSEIRAGNQYDSYLREIDKEAGKIDKQLRKFKGEMTKEQLTKYKKADKLLSKTPI